MAIRYGTPEWDEAMEAQRRKRERAGFHGRTLPGKYDTARKSGASRLTEGAASEQSGRDRYSKGAISVTSAVANGMKRRRRS